MPNWDEDSPQLRANLARVLGMVEASALARAQASLDDVKHWHAEMMAGLAVPHDYPDPEVRGHFRGDAAFPSLAFDVQIGRHRGTPWKRVVREVAAFVGSLNTRLATLDALIAPGSQPQSETDLEHVLEVAAWAHAEWVRIHPFGNGNGRTARLWANWILMRFGLPPFVTLRPRPGGGYGSAGEAAMRGRTRPTHDLFRAMLDDWIANHP